MHRLAALSLCFALGACQGPNPYRAESLPLPPAPPAVAAPLEPGVYPAPPRDYAAYRDWAWLHDHPPDGDAGLDAAQVQEILSAELDRRGLRPARPGAEADLRVSAQLTLKRRIRIYRDYYDRFGGYYGYGHHWDRFGVWGRAPSSTATRNRCWWCASRSPPAWTADGSGTAAARRASTPSKAAAPRPCGRRPGSPCKAFRRSPEWSLPSTFKNI
ncbi:DUF4136 domain-containing protein [Azorhizophilus paspali]|uniref:DUF4136 domain-containing protein n=1 Tax=Azorhizophilus paspali TaxID=69963 RepID=UPI003632961C